uniref:Cation/H(+) antiporter 4-like n=1 Tax=Nicotiana sylvestris TaxID=4096 RepID=A0A1U7WDA5_NICSY|nr:PREDICTED: cation/H(+) antiporter 4-like [Nicotiana sylvestris]
MSNNTDSISTQKVLQCVRFPPRGFSLGIFGKENNPWTYSVPTIQSQILLIYVVTQLFHTPLKRLGFPKISSEIFAGLILGSTLLGRYRSYQESLFPIASQGILGALSTFGYLLFLFLSGVKMDTSLTRKIGRRALVIGILNHLVPLIAGMITVFALSRSFFQEGATTVSPSVEVITIAKTSFPVISFLLKDLGLLNSELGRLALSSALISDLFGLTITVISVLVVISATGTLARAVKDAILFIIFIIVVIFVFRPLMILVAKRTPEGRPVKDLYILLIVLAVLLSGVFSDWAEQTVLVGPFIFGLAVPEGPPLGSTLVDKLDPFASGFLLPIFVSLMSLRTNLSAINPSSSFTFANIILMCVASISKILACFLPMLYCKMPLNDAVALSLIMSTRGVVDLATYSFLRDTKIINQETFAFMVLATLFTAVFVQIMVSWLYDPSRKYAGYQRRNLMNSNNKLPILFCIHNQDNTAAILRLLEKSNPNRDFPIVANVLHLIELRGRASSVFISHQVQTKAISDVSYSENVILAFQGYERNNYGAVTIQAFTAISPGNLMHEDICTLALDVLASIIILPFHRKWAVDGSVEVEYHSLRTLNCSVLERAPCSVGILVDRGQLRRSNSVRSSQNAYCVAMLFLGGNDDQEALTFAKRMAISGTISLTVIRLSSKKEMSSNVDQVIDLDIVGDWKHSRSGWENVQYIEHQVNETTETALLVHSLVDEYDLIITGRRNNIHCLLTAGLEEWSEIPELGVIGDMLASKDLKTRASVLVIQQQQIAM